MEMKRTGETGELVINGRLGLITSWLRWLQPWMITSLIIPMVLWTFSHYYAHKDIEIFTQRGSRVYSSTGEDISTNQLKMELMSGVREYVSQTVPPADVTRRLEALEQLAHENHEILLRLLQENRIK